MAVYIIHMFEILLLDYFLPSRVKHQKMYLLIQFLILVLLYTLRSYTVGRDTYQFVTAFDSFNGNAYYNRKLESGFEWLCKIVGQFSQDYHILFLVIAVFFFLVLVFFIRNNSADTVLSLYLFTTMTFFPFILSSMRQAIAVGIVLLFSEIALKKKHYLIFSFGVILATLFHYSAIISLLLIIINNIRFTKKILVSLTVTAIILPMLADLIFSLAIMFLPYAGYIGTKYYETSLLGAFFNLAIWLFLFSIPVIVFLFCSKGNLALQCSQRINASTNSHFWKKFKKGRLVISKKSRQLDYSPDFLLLCSAVTVLIAVLSLRISVVSRAIYYFGMFNIILLPNSIRLFSKKETRIAVRLTVIIVSFAVWGIISVFRPEWYDAVPYISDLF